MREEKDMMNLEEDVYCNLMLNIIELREASQYSDKSHTGKLLPPGGRWPVLHAVLLWVINLIFQFLIVVLVLLAAEQEEYPLEDTTFLSDYSRTREEVTSALNEATIANNRTLPAWFDSKLETVCGEQMVPSFLMTCSIMTLLWIIVMVGEAKAGIWWAIFILRAEEPELQARSDAESLQSPRNSDYDPLEDENDMDSDDVLVFTDRSVNSAQVIIVGLTPCLKFILFITVPLTRLLLSFLLILAGTKFIFLQTHLSNAVLKAMTLKFVITIDEVLIKALSTKYGGRELRTSRIYSKGARTTCGMGSKWGKRVADNWEQIGGMVWIAVSFLVWTLLYLLPFAGEMSFRRACLGYHQQFPGAFNIRERLSVSEALHMLLNEPTGR